MPGRVRPSTNADGRGSGRRRAVLAYTVIILLGLAGCHKPVRRPSHPADTFLIVIDTLRADHVSLYGYLRATTPHLEAFARDAVVYDHAITPGTWTVPAHAALFTGKWPSYAGAERVAGHGI